MTEATTGPVAKSFDAPDDVNTLPSGRARAEVLAIAGGRLVRSTTQAGFRWSTDVRPLMGGDACTMAHFGIVLEGRYHFEFGDGTTLDLDAGGVFQIPPDRPHDEWVVGDAPCRAIDIYVQGSGS